VGCGASRETKNIWWYLFSSWDNYAGKGKSRWRGWDLFHKRFWKSRKYIFHDSCGVFWNRWVKCELWGHKRVQDIGCGETPEWYCFDCHQKVEGDIK
jgi:hypothetical protein